MPIALPRGARSLAMLVGFLIICALFWTLELPSPEGDFAKMRPSSEEDGPILGRYSREDSLALQAPAPQPPIDSSNQIETLPRDSQRNDNYLQSKRIFSDIQGKLAFRENTETFEKTAILEPQSSVKMKVENLNEKVVIEDAFNSIQLQPLPSDIDTTSNQSSIDVIFFAKYAFNNMKIPRGLSATVASILRHTQTPLMVHVLTDKPSFLRIRRTFSILQQRTRTPFRFSLYDVGEIESRYNDAIALMREFFFTKWIARYNDNIFFITPVFHLAFAGKLQRAIFLDADLQFHADIVDLWAKFAEFTKDNLIGIAHDLQPHYRSEFAAYRKRHPGTDVGSPRPGKQGFNTGVMLMDFGRMSNCPTYENLLKNTSLEKLTEKYHFHGYLGHQDFFTLLGVEYPEMFYLLDCSWNRQLDTSWRKHYGPEIFDRYHKCSDPIRVIHGNGNHILLPEGLQNKSS